ncbi:MAG: class I SAM-dependent methyltransferase [Deltaproteobacteria bacterium]|nr:class I SAM-dependent methyltransferase [Deltaproteobacteria bacterium]
MSGQRHALLQQVEAYYTAKVVEHGPTARGVDWNSEASQQLRFQQLLRVLDSERGPFSFNDIGCGFGALAAYLQTNCQVPFHYHGFDLAPAMIRYAHEQYGHLANCRFSDAPASLTTAHYTVASGIFNVKLSTELEEWRTYMLDTIEQMAQLSTRGFAFNVLTSYSDRERMRPDLYYADPGFLFDYCQRHYSRWVAILHDYGLYEFTVIVRKEERG